MNFLAYISLLAAVALAFPNPFPEGLAEPVPIYCPCGVSRSSLSVMVGTRESNTMVVE